MKAVLFLFAISALAGFANAACPKTEKEFLDLAAPFLIERASKETHGITTDFSTQLGKGAVSGAANFKSGEETLYFVRADYKTESVSGILKCDPVQNKIIVITLGWDNGKKGSGVKGGPLD
jgi:hypothetical protein